MQKVVDEINNAMGFESEGVKLYPHMMVPNVSLRKAAKGIYELYCKIKWINVLLYRYFQHCYWYDFEAIGLMIPQ